MTPKHAGRRDNLWRTCPRAGFTLVEVLVAVALTLFIMSILSEAFIAGAKVFRDFKAIGDMNARLRSASRTLINDLASYHFDGTRKLSDPNFWDSTMSGGPPAEGYFRIAQKSADTREGGATGADLDGIPSYRNDGGTWLQFTVNKSGEGNKPQAYFRSYPPSGSPLLSLVKGDSRFQDLDPANATPPEKYTSFNSPWAEVAWFMQQKNAADVIAGTTTKLYTLYRRQRVVVPPGAGTLASQVSFSTSGYDGISCKSDGTSGMSAPFYYFNSPSDLTMPPRRFAMAGYTDTAMTPQLQSALPTAAVANTDTAYCGLFPGNSPQGGMTGAAEFATLSGTDDVILTDVLSFDVRILVPTMTDFYDIADSALPAANKNLNPGLVAAGYTVFDTWSLTTSDPLYNYGGWDTPSTNASAPYKTRILAIKVSIRIWDFKTEQARQVTIIQNM